MKHKPCKLMLYWDWISEEAALINADGCTGVTNYQGRCCLQHDLEFYYGASASDAYRRYRDGDPYYWFNADLLSFEIANAHFKACHFRNSKLGYRDPAAWWRYAAMRLKKTRAAWDAHRKREATGPLEAA